MDRLTIVTNKINKIDGNFSNKIFFCDKAYFTLGGHVNKQNCRIWHSEYPQVVEEYPFH